jgi:hypothetical protein
MLLMLLMLSMLLTLLTLLTTHGARCEYSATCRAVQ